METIERILRGKASGRDRMEEECLKLGEKAVKEEMWRINRVWEGERWLQEWKTDLVLPILKKRNRRKVEDYRGVKIEREEYRGWGEV